MPRNNSKSRKIERRDFAARSAEMAEQRQHKRTMAIIEAYAKRNEALAYGERATD